MNKKYKLHNKNVKKTQRKKLNKDGGFFNILGRRTRSGQRKQFNSLISKNKHDKYLGIGEVLDRLKKNTTNYENALSEYKNASDSLKDSEANYNKTYKNLDNTISILDRNIMEIYNFRRDLKNVGTTHVTGTSADTNDPSNATGTSADKNDGSDILKNIGFQ